MNQPAKAAEPTMEEILASIRRIIADDDAGKSAKMKPEQVPSNTDEIAAMLEGEATEDNGAAASDVLELTESMQARPPFETLEGAPDITFSESAALPPEPAQPEAARVESPRVGPSRSDAMRADAMDPDPLPYDRGLLSPRTAASVDVAFNSLAHTILVQNSRTLDDLVREMLKPMLKAWLDDNLPNMVERLVRAEIERVSRGRG
jgi:uncharacterized protein